MSGEELTRFLNRLDKGADLDLRGTRMSEERFARHVQIDVRADWVSCVGTRFDQGVIQIGISARRTPGSPAGLFTGYGQRASRALAWFAGPVLLVLAVRAR